MRGRLKPAVWMRTEDDDPSDEYEFQSVLGSAIGWHRADFEGWAVFLRKAYLSVCDRDHLRELSWSGSFDCDSSHKEDRRRQQVDFPGISNLVSRAHSNFRGCGIRAAIGPLISSAKLLGFQLSSTARSKLPIDDDPSPRNSSLLIRSVHTASPFSSQVTQYASPIGMNLSSASRTPIEPGTCP